MYSSFLSLSSLFLWQTFNALFIVRVCVKYFTECLKEDDVIKQIESMGSAEAGTSEEDKPSLETLVELLVEIVVELPLQ